MELNSQDQKLPDGSDRPRRTALSLLVFVALLGFTVAIASLVVLWRGPWRIPLPNPALVPPPTVAIDGGLGLSAVLLGVILLLLFGVFVLLLVLVLCVCCCGCGKDGGLSRLLALLIPGLAAGLRTGAKGFDVSAIAAHAAIGPLHTTGLALRDTLGPALQQIQVPKAALPTTLLWDVLHDHHIVHGTRTHSWDNLYVVTGAQLETQPLFDGPDGLGTKVTDAGGQLYAGGDRAAVLETDLRKAAGGLRAAATTLDGQP